MVKIIIIKQRRDSMNYEAAAEFWLEKDKDAVKMPTDEMQK